METRSKGGDNDAKELLIKRVLRNEINTAIPGIIQSFSAETQTVQVIPAIRSIETLDNEQTFKQLPKLIQVPVRSIYGKGAGFSLTFPISKNDECLLVFSQRAIDNWHEFGGVQNPVEPVVPRMFNISDAYALVGISSLPNVISGYQGDCIEIRNSGRQTRVSVYNNKVEIIAGTSEIIINKDGDVNIKTDTDVNVQADNINIDTDGDVIANVGGDLEATITGDATVEADNVNVTALTKTIITSPTTDWLGEMIMVGHMKITGLLEVVGIIKGTADIIALSEDDDPITALTHIHTGDSGGDTGEPKAP